MPTLADPATDQPAGLRLTVRATSRGVLAGVLGVVLVVGGFVLSYVGVVALGAGLVLLVLFSLVSVLLPAPISPTRRVHPLRVVRNGRCQGVLRISSAARRVGVSLDVDESIGDQRVPVLVPRLAPGNVVDISYPVPTTRRGVVEVGPLRLRRVGTAGLFMAHGLVPGTVRVHVMPRVLPVHGLPAGARRGHVGAEERVERGGTDLVALREYVPGDDLRRVHWATTARSGTLMVREDADPARPYLSVLLDDRADSYAAELFEDAVEAAASLVASVVEAGHPIRLISVSGRLDVDVPAAPTGMIAPGAEELLTELAAVTPAAEVDSPATVPVRDLDVVVVVTGSRGGLEAMVAEAARAPLGVVMMLDPAFSHVEAHGTVLVLRGPRVEEVLHGWDQAVTS